jgi:hypothetical protein
MRLAFSARAICFIVTVSFCVCAALPGGARAQQSEDPCDELRTPKLIKEGYFERAKYKEIFPCLAKIIKGGKYRTSPSLLTEHMFPVLDHYFTNSLDKDTEYKLGELLWRIMVTSGDETGAKAVEEFKWSQQISSAVNRELRRFNDPASIKIEPPKATITRRKDTKFTVTYLNVADIPLKSKALSVRSEVRPEEKATSRMQGGQLIVTGLKGGGQTGSLIVRDADRKLAAQAQLTFSGGISILWPVSGLVITGGAAAGAAIAEDGASTALWAVTGVSAAVTGYLFYQYFRGGGVPFLTESDRDHSSGNLAMSFVPGPRSLEFHMRF